MRPIKFKEANRILAENSDLYTPLPAFKNEDPLGETISCWKLSFLERIRVLFSGKVYVSLLTFNKPLQPIFMTTKKSDLFQKKSKTK